MIRRFVRKLLKMLTSRRTLPPPTRPYIQKLNLLARWRFTSECAGERSHSVLNQHSAKETPTVERRIRASQLAPLHERITVRHEVGPTRRNETQPYAIIRSMHACDLDRGRLIKYAFARRPKDILRDGESARFDWELIHMAEFGTHNPRRVAGQQADREAGYHFWTDNVELLRREQGFVKRVLCVARRGNEEIRREALRDC